LLTPSEVLVNLQSAGNPPAIRHPDELSGAKSSPVITGGERQSAVSSYFLGNDPAKWVAGAPNFARVRYRELYPGVDWLSMETRAAWSTTLWLPRAPEPEAITAAV
jgi:hypothetical protein